MTTTVSATMAVLVWKNLVGSASKETVQNANYAQVLVLVLITLTALGQLITVTMAVTPLKAFGIYLTTVATIWLSTTWFVFASLYTGRVAMLTRPRLVGLFGASVALSVGFVSGGLDGQTLTPHVFETVESAEGPSLKFDVVTAAVAVYSIAVSAVAVKFLFEKFLTSRNVYRKISFLHIVGGTVLTVGGAISLAGLSPLPYISLGPTAFSVVMVVSAPTIISYRYLQLLPLDRVLSVLGGRFRSLTPMARDTIMENMESGVLVLDHDNRLVDINPLGRRMLMTEDRRIIGEPLKEVLPPDVFDTDDTGFLDPTTVDQTYRGIWTNSIAERQRCFDIQITALGSSEEPAGRVGLINDVTDREIRKEQLEQRTDELERQNEQLADFAGVVSHDLRNPLTVANGYLERAQGTDDDEALLAEAERSLDRMEAIIDDVLALAREGQPIGSTEEASLDATATEAWANVDTTAATFVVADDAAFDADRDRLLNLFENLFRNSVEHSDDDDDVTVSVGCVEDGFFVADDGPGIPEGERADVTASGYTTTEGGTGFGLAIVDQIAEAHGWTVVVGESDAGGAQFSFTGIDDSNAPMRGDTQRK